MTIHLDKIYQNSHTHLVFSADTETMEKSQKIAIDAIMLYLKDVNNTVCLQRTYSLEEALENLDLITELEDYPYQIQLSYKKRKRSIDTPLDCVVHTSPYVQPLTIHKETQRDFHTVLETVMKDGLELRYASRRLQNNEVIVFHAVRQNGFALQYASKKQIQSSHIVLQAVRQNGLALQYASKKQIESSYIVLEAVRQNGLALQYASPNLRDRFDIVGEAVRQNNLAFFLASKRLQTDAEIIGLAKGLKINNGLHNQHWVSQTFSHYHRSITSN